MQIAGLQVMLATMLAGNAATSPPAALPDLVRCTVASVAGCDAHGSCTGEPIAGPPIVLDIRPREGGLDLNGIAGRVRDGDAIAFDRDAEVTWDRTLSGRTVLRLGAAPDGDRAMSGTLDYNYIAGSSSRVVLDCRGEPLNPSPAASAPPSPRSG